MAEVYVGLKNFLLAERSTTYVEFLVLEIDYNRARLSPEERRLSSFINKESLYSFRLHMVFRSNSCQAIIKIRSGWEVSFPEVLEKILHTHPSRSREGSFSSRVRRKA